MINDLIEIEPIFINVMSFDTNNQPQRSQIDSDTWIKLLKELNAIEIDSWQEGNFSYSFLRLGNRINVQPNYFLKATNLKTKEERAIRIPASIQSGREALNWIISAV